MTKLEGLNPLVLGENGVWTLASATEQFDYSDGAKTEQYLREVFDKTSDLSAQSYSLKEAIYDWPSEYHLTPQRGNLFRPFDLSVFNSVLDIGSGCGSIARYLGEHIAVVDAVEGAPIRADLARRRCKDLDNVNIINANFNHLNLAGANYQLATLIGVAEYAGKFYPDASSDREAVIGLLQNVANALDDDGVVMIAIENRLGAKYMLGQPEDHYHSPYEGINGYPRKEGMCTYDVAQWQSLLSETAFNHHTFYGSFFDYKLPTLLIGEDYANDPQVANHLLPYSIGVEVGPWSKGQVDKIWDTMAQLGQVMEMANSFFIIAAKSQAGLDRLAKLDFAHTPSFSRRLEFSTVVKKERGQNEVQRVPIGESPAMDNAHWQFQPHNEPFYRGKSLLKDWLDTFMLKGALAESQSKIGHYYGVVKSLEEEGVLAVDALPQNILIDGDNIHLFDQEWSVDKHSLAVPLADFVLFRALLYLAPFGRYLGDFYSLWNCRTHSDFVFEALQYMGISADQHFDAFVSLEEEFLSYAQGQQASLGYLTAPIADARKFDEAPWLWSTFSIYREGREKHSWQQSYPVNNNQSSVKVEVGAGVSIADGDRVQFSPCDYRRSLGVGLFSIDSVRFLFEDDTHHYLNLKPAKINDLVLSELSNRFTYAIDGVAPFIELNVEGVGKKRGLTSIEVVFAMRSSIEYWQIDQQLLLERDQLKVEIAELRRLVTTPHLPANMVNDPVPRDLPSEVIPLKAKVLRKLKTEPVDISTLPSRAIPMDWRFMPPIGDKKSTEAKIDSLAVITQSQLSAQTKKALTHLCHSHRVIEIESDHISNVLARCDSQWILVIDDKRTLRPFQLEKETLEGNDTCVYYGDELATHQGWSGIRREPQSLKYAALGGYTGVGAVLINPNAKKALLKSSFNFNDSTLAYSVVLAAIKEGIAAKHCQRAITICQYPVFCWPPQASIAKGYDSARQQFAESIDELIAVKAPHIDGLAPLQFQGEAEPKISIFIPFKDNAALLESCIKQVIGNTWYTNYEIIGVNNASIMERTVEVMTQLEKAYDKVRFITINEEFNYSRINNLAVAQTDSEYIVFLNNDVLIDTPDWVQYLLAPFYVDGQCGITGACLNYPEGIVQSCGIAIGEEGLPVNVGNNMLANDEALFGRLFATRDVLAVSAALMMTRRDVFERLNGFNETDFGIAFNDVDYCLRAKNEGLDVVAVANTKARHLESYSRLSDTVNGSKYARFLAEQQSFKRIHADYAEKADPFHPEIGLSSSHVAG